MNIIFRVCFIRGRDLTRQFICYPALEVPEDNMHVLSQTHWGYPRFLSLNMLGYCLPLEYFWLMSCMSHRNLSGRCLMQVHSFYSCHIYSVIFAFTQTLHCSTDNLSYIDSKFVDLEKHCTEHLTKSMKFYKVEIERFLHLRYEGTDCALMCLPHEITTSSQAHSKYGDFIGSFVER